MSSGSLITAHKIYELNESPEVKKFINELKEKEEIGHTKQNIPAAAGDIAGEAINFFLSDPVQALTTSLVLGNLLWEFVKTLRNKNFDFSIHKQGVRLLALSKTQDKISNEELNERHKIWGPMKTDWTKLQTSKQEISIYNPVSYYIVISVRYKKDKITMYHYLFHFRGEIRAEWRTQTFEERVPDFFTP